MMERYEFAISIGPSCRAAFHIRRVFGDVFCPSGIFDWQVTPWPGFLAYLERDFIGMFELADLAPGADGVVNTRFSTTHPHEFIPAADKAAIRAAYQDARARHDHLTAKTRSILRGLDPILIVQSDPLPGDAYGGISSAIHAYNPALPFRLMPAPEGGHEPSANSEEWQGDHAVWTRHLTAAVA